MPGVGDGIVIPGPPLRWLTIVDHHVTIENGGAVTEVDQAFRKSSPFPREIYLHYLRPARDPAAFILERLAPDDRFGVIAFDHEILVLTGKRGSEAVAPSSLVREEDRATVALPLMDLIGA